MAAIISQSSTAACTHCGKDIPTSNIDLHYVHCFRNLEKCSVCGEMVPKKHASEHYGNNHAPIDCIHCGEAVERKSLALHRGERCPQRIIACEYCEFPLPAVDLYKHQDMCGNRTEFCDACGQYVRLCQRAEHELRSHNHSNSASGSPRVDGSPGREGGDANGRRPASTSPGRMMLTIAVTGAAFLLVSVFLQRRIDG
ncbi:unnamed protein product [Spirodela intermedia]|uniref:Uncharacterized protein n=2 Tax=Spirodela intermedia TaxID=51605 RepID=A0A7I8IIW7_SPIIN|nr:unnamed protein product [Spirodela intermedia]CAA6657825.1 unnamed protein product [Spirodela intermedia]CAA7393952.1 unnamed protein product [Spirodela intermedia]